ncbi:unnamed protein product [Thlaspi arvense]|uniref:Uncharacterized protein n=1 Tax=Thlaspi arvense TaxID=13288 RepID=A0AAU9S6F1_THLAR|nr:unnamed protein product [Thlaspi arvense]
MLLDPAKMRRNVENKTPRSSKLSEEEHRLKRKKETTIRISVMKAMRPPPLELSKRTTTRKKVSEVHIEPLTKKAKERSSTKRSLRRRRSQTGKSVAISSLTILAVIGLQKLFSALRPPSVSRRNRAEILCLRRNRRENTVSPPESSEIYCAALSKSLNRLLFFSFSRSCLSFSSLLPFLFFLSSLLLLSLRQRTEPQRLVFFARTMLLSLSRLLSSGIIAPGVPIIFVRTKLDLRDDKAILHHAQAFVLNWHALSQNLTRRSLDSKLGDSLGWENKKTCIIATLSPAVHWSRGDLKCSRLRTQGQSILGANQSFNQKNDDICLDKGPRAMVKLERLTLMRAMAEQIEQMGGQTENYQKVLLEEMQGKYTTGQARDCSDLTNRLDLSQTSKMLASTNRGTAEISICHEGGKISLLQSRKKAGREDKLSADNRKVVDNYQAILVRASRDIFTSHLEAVQNVVRLHKPNSSAASRKFQHWRTSISCFPGMGQHTVVMRNGSLCRGIETGGFKNSTALKMPSLPTKRSRMKHVSVFPCKLRMNAREGADFSAAKTLSNGVAASAICGSCGVSFQTLQLKTHESLNSKQVADVSLLVNSACDNDPARYMSQEVAILGWIIPEPFATPPNSNCGSSDLRNTVTQGAEREKGKKDYTREKGTESDIELTSVGSSWRSSFCKTFTGREEMGKLEGGMHLFLEQSPGSTSGEAADFCTVLVWKSNIKLEP